MSSEWMKVMLDEIARKGAEAAQAQMELERRRAENEIPSVTTPRATTPRATAPSGGASGNDALGNGSAARR